MAASVQDVQGTIDIVDEHGHGAVASTAVEQRVDVARALVDQLVVLGMSADPEPHEAVLRFNGLCTEMVSDSCRPILTDLLESE